MDYVSTPPSSAYDRALQLAEDIAKNGGFLEDVSRMTYLSAILVAPLALRAAKQAISRAADLSLESGKRELSPSVRAATHIPQVSTLKEHRTISFSLPKTA